MSVSHSVCLGDSHNTVMGAGLSLFALSAWRLSLPLFARILGGCAALFLAVGLYLALSAMYMQHQEHLQLQKEVCHHTGLSLGSLLR